MIVFKTLISLIFKIYLILSQQSIRDGLRYICHYLPNDQFINLSPSSLSKSTSMLSSPVTFFLHMSLMAVSRRQNELVGKFKMAAGDKVSIRGQVMDYMYVPTGIKRELVRSGVDWDWKG